MYRSRLLRSLAVPLLIVCMPLSSHGPAHAAADRAAGLYGTNLIVNGDAESVTVSGKVVVGKSAGSYDNLVPPPGWKLQGNITEVSYGSASDVPGPSSPGPSAADRGKNFFWGGHNSDADSAQQTVDVSSIAGAIDGGAVPFTLSAYLGGYEGQDDHSTLAATFLDSSGTKLGKPVQIGPVLDAERKSQTGMLPKSTTGQVPAGTRSIVVTLTMTRISGSDNDANADNLSLILTAPSTTGPSATPATGSTTCSVPAATVVSTTAPASKALVPGGAPVAFAWTPIRCASFYNLQIWLQKAASGQTVGKQSLSLTALRLKGSSYSLATGGWLKGVYAWRIVAADARGSILGKWSPEKTFTIE